MSAREREGRWGAPTGGGAALPRPSDGARVGSTADIDRGCTPSPATWQGHAAAAARARRVGSPQGRWGALPRPSDGGAWGARRTSTGVAPRAPPRGRATLRLRREPGGWGAPRGGGERYRAQATGARGEHGGHRPGLHPEPRQVAGPRCGASQEGGEPPGAVSADHRALPPCRTREGGDLAFSVSIAYNSGVFFLLCYE